MIIIYIPLTLLFIFFIYYFRLFLFLFPKNRLTILMYHQIEKETQDDLTVNLENLEKQFKYFSDKKYDSKFFSEINRSQKKSIIITFDDGYKNNFDHLPSLLEKYHLKATLFISTKFIQEGYEDYEIMTFDHIKNLDKKYFEIGLHSHAHENFKNMTTSSIENDLKENMLILDQHNINYSKVLAYPYGKYPKTNPTKENLFKIFKNLGIDFAVRIGNNINYFPTKKPYELCRIDIKGSDSLIKFKAKLILGKIKLF